MRIKYLTYFCLTALLCVSCKVNGGYSLRLDYYGKEDIKNINWEDIYKIKKIYLVEMNYLATDDVIEKVSKLKEVKELVIKSNNITDKSMEYISRMGTIEGIQLQSWSITDAGLGHLKKLKNLKKLYIALPKMTENGIKIIGQMKQLESLKIDDFEVYNEDIEHIQELKELRELKLYQSQIDDEGARLIGYFKKLEQLTLLYCMAKDKGITDKGLIYFKDLERLRTLDLRMNKHITDKGLEYIVEIKGFKLAYWEPCKSWQHYEECPQGLINLGITSVTEEGAEWLRKKN